MILINVSTVVIAFIDDYPFIYLLKNKSDAFDMFKLFVTKLESPFNRKIRRLCSDREIELDLVAFNNFYNTHGVIHEKATPYSLKMDHKTERKNKTLSELVVAFLLDS